MIRAFIAVDLPDPLTQEIAQLQSDLRTSGADVKWVEPKNLHLTLKFLGNMEETQVDSLKVALQEATKGVGSFPISLEGIGAFPRTTSPRVIWIGVTQGKEPLEDLSKKVEAVCLKLGFPAEERNFTAHLTIGRVRSRDRLASLIKRLQVAEFRAGTPATVDKLILYQSTLSPHGPTYTPLAEISLTPPG